LDIAELARWRTRTPGWHSDHLRVQPACSSRIVLGTVDQFGDVILVLIVILLLFIVAIRFTICKLPRSLVETRRCTKLLLVCNGISHNIVSHVKSLLQTFLHGVSGLLGVSFQAQL
jgi:hypothetical protein